MHWRFSHVDLEGPHGWKHLKAEKLAALLAQFKAWECLTDGELFNHHGNTPIASDSLDKPARDRLVELELDDQDGLWHLRMSGSERIWGFRAANSFSLLWWDPDHKVQEYKKKHT
jgi:hypothetical protein